MGILTCFDLLDKDLPGVDGTKKSQKKRLVYYFPNSIPANPLGHRTLAFPGPIH